MVERFADVHQGTTLFLVEKFVWGKLPSGKDGLNKLCAVFESKYIVLLAEFKSPLWVL